MKTILFIDGRNFIGKLETVFESQEISIPAWDTYDFKGLLPHVLQDILIDEVIFYFANIREHPDTKQKSQELIQKRRKLKTHLEKQGFKVVMSGTVRGNYKKNIHGREVLIFKEKGVDIGMAVDMIVGACDGKLKTVIIGSSDSDLQPAIRELGKRKVETIYLGFEIMPNKGLTYTTKRTILVRNSEVLKFRQEFPFTK